MRGRECIIVNIRAGMRPAKCEYQGLGYVYIYRLKNRQYYQQLESQTLTPSYHNSLPLIRHVTKINVLEISNPLPPTAIPILTFPAQAHSQTAARSSVPQPTPSTSVSVVVAASGA